jgi:putative transposase
MSRVSVTFFSVKRVERVRIYPKAKQMERLRFILDVTCDLYNALLEERREAWRRRGIAVSTRQQYAELTALRKENARVGAVYRECEDAVLHRLDLAFRAFFCRVRRSQTPGYPRYKKRSRFSQIEFPHGNRALKLNSTQTKVTVPGVGAIRLRKGRSVPAFGRAWLVFRNGRWYASFECHRVARPLPKTGRVVGVDRGVHVLVATSDGVLIYNTRHHERSRRNIERAQRMVRRRRPRGMNRRKSVIKLARLYERIANQRRDHLHKIARRTVNASDVIALEALNLRAMTRSAKGTINAPGQNVRAKSALNQSILDASFGQLHQLLNEKAEEAARSVVLVDAHYSSQTCSRCGHVAAESRRKRRYACVKCGFAVHADINAALVIRRRAESRPAGRGAASADLYDLRSAPYAGAEPVSHT